MSRGTVRMSIPSENLRVSLTSWFMIGICDVFGSLTAWIHFSLGMSWQKWLLGWGLWTFIIPTAIWIWAVEIGSRAGTGEKRRV